MSREGKEKLRALYRKVAGHAEDVPAEDGYLLREIIYQLSHHTWPEGLTFAEVKEVIMIAREEVDDLWEHLPPMQWAWLCEQLAGTPAVQGTEVM